MRSLLIGTAVISGVMFGGTASSSATLLSSAVVSGPNVLVTPVEKVGYWRRLYRHGYVAPYVYYPPAYGYYAPAPPAYAHYPPAYAYAPPPAYNYPPAYRDHALPENGGYAESPPAQGYEEPSPEDGGYAENPPAHGYEAPPPEGGSQ